MGSVFVGTTSQWMRLQSSCNDLVGLGLDVGILAIPCQQVVLVKVFERHRESHRPSVVLVEREFDYNSIDAAADWLANQVSAYRSWR